MSKPSFLQRLASLATLLEPTRRKLYDYVAGEREPVSRDAAARTAGVSRAMAAFHLDRLVEVGLLRADYRRLGGRAGRGAGRPSKLYRRSRHRFSLTLPDRNHELLARLLAESIASKDGPTPTPESARRYGHLLGVRARKRLRERASPAKLAGCVLDITDELGFEPTLRPTGEKWMRNCPFDPLSRQYPAVACQTALQIIGGVIEGVGAGTLRVSRRERNDWCCVVLSERSMAAPMAPPKTATDM